MNNGADLSKVRLRLIAYLVLWARRLSDGSGLECGGGAQGRLDRSGPEVLMGHWAQMQPEVGAIRQPTDRVGTEGSTLEDDEDIEMLLRLAGSLS
jgi:hypothetical protein